VTIMWQNLPFVTIVETANLAGTDDLARRRMTCRLTQPSSHLYEIVASGDLNLTARSKSLSRGNVVATSVRVNLVIRDGGCKEHIPSVIRIDMYFTVPCSVYCGYSVIWIRYFCISVSNAVIMGYIHASD